MKRGALIASILLLTAANCGRPADVEKTVTQRQATTPRPAPIPENLNVVTIGDSLAYGAGDETGRGIAGRLKNELLDRGLDAPETVNLGTNGARTGDVIARLKQERVRSSLAQADAIVLSIGANDLFRSPGSREETLRNPLAVAERILDRIEGIVTELHAIAPDARILILGGYNPVPNHPMGSTIDQYLGLWDAALAGRFEDHPYVAVVKMSDIVTRQRLSRYDSFHPGGQAYAEAAKRIADMLMRA
jgi:lysophospholipase L1-like esterase